MIWYMTYICEGDHSTYTTYKHTYIYLFIHKIITWDNRHWRCHHWTCCWLCHLPGESPELSHAFPQYCNRAYSSCNFPWTHLLCLWNSHWSTWSTAEGQGTARTPPFSPPSSPPSAPCCGRHSRPPLPFPVLGLLPRNQSLK